MGMSASQARLLTITARITTNEYESQQLSNAKMRLATESEQASRDYIDALDSRKMMFTTYDAQGSPVYESLTATALYTYSDLKNQYALINQNGQMLLSTEDARKYESVNNLDEFLASYGITKIYKSETLQKNADLLNSPTYVGYYTDWVAAIENVKSKTYSGSCLKEDGSIENYTNVPSDKAYEYAKIDTYNKYMNAYDAYKDAIIKYDSGIDVDISAFTIALAEAKVNYSDSITYENWLKSQAAFDTTGGVKVESNEFKNINKYYEVLNEMLAEAEDLGCSTIQDMYSYSDEAKARWYTNLWYRLNGESSDKSIQGINKANYVELDPNLAGNTQWMKDALRQGYITIEVSSYKESTNLIPKLWNEEMVNGSDKSTILIPGVNKPLNVQLKGITWSSTIYTSCTDFAEFDDDEAIAKAEAEYERKTKEINAKDERYTNKIKVLDTEHNSLQTEYESVQSAMNKNIERSFKAFS